MHPPTIGVREGIQPNPALDVDTQNSWGRSSEIVEGNSEQVIRVQKTTDMGVFLVSVRAIDVNQGTNPTIVYPRALVQYGNGNVLNSDIVDATGGMQMVVVGTTVMVKVFLSDAEGNPPENGSGASATFQAWTSWGITPYPERNTSTFKGGGAATGVLTGAGNVIQGRTFGFRGTSNLGAATFLQFFDSDEVPTGASVPIGEAVLPSGVAQWELPFPNTKAFLHGLAWGLSSTPGVYTAATGTAFSIYAEVANNG